MGALDEMATCVTSALTRAGWVVTFTTVPALVVEGHDAPMIRVGATRFDGELRAIVTMLDPSGPNARGVGRVSRPIPGTRWIVQAEVADLRAARSTAEALGPGLLAGTALEAAVRTLESIGWAIGHHEATFLDEPQWELRGARGDEQLTVSVVFAANPIVASSAVQIEPFSSSMSIRTAHCSAFVTVASVALAGDLVDAIAADLAPIHSTR